MAEAGREPKGSKKKLIAVLVIVFVAMAAVFGGIAALSFAGERASAVIVRPEAYIYEEDSALFEVLACDEESITVSSLEGLDGYDVMVSGVTPNAPAGFLRTLGDATPVDGGYRIAAEPAPLTAAIEQCDFSATITFYEDGTVEVEETEESDDAGFLSGFVSQAFADEDFETNLVDKDFGPFYAKAGFQFVFDLKIQDEAVTATMLGHFVAGSGFDFGASEDEEDEKADEASSGAFDLDDVLFEAEKPVTFFIGPVPVEITFATSLDADLAVRLEGLEISTELILDRTWGIEYSSADGFSVINEDDSTLPGLSFDATSSEIAISLEAGLGLSLEGMLYGIAGPELGIGIQNEVTGALGETVSDDGFTLPRGDAHYQGRLAARGYVPISGCLKAGIPDFNPFDWTDDDEGGADLLNIQLFDSEDALTFYEINESYGVNMKTYRIVEGDPINGNEPVFEFDYPDTWTVESTDSLVVDGVSSYHVELRSPDGCKVSFTHFPPSDVLPNGLLDGYLTRVSGADLKPRPFHESADGQGFDSFIVAEDDGDFHGKRIGEAGESELSKDFDWQCSLVPSSWTGRCTELPAIVSEGERSRTIYRLCFPYEGCLYMNASTDVGAGDPSVIDKMDAVAIMKSLRAKNVRDI